MKQARSAQNRRSYEKRCIRANADVTVPETVRGRAGWPNVFENGAIVRRFREGSDLLCFDSIEIGDRELRDISSLPPYPSTTTSIVKDDDDWDALFSALYGYQIRMYTQQLDAKLIAYRTTSKLDFSASLLRRYRSLLETLDTLDSLSRRYSKEGDHIAASISCHNAQWTAALIVYTYDDLKAVSQGDDSYITAICDRKYSLGRVY